MKRLRWLFLTLLLGALLGADGPSPRSAVAAGIWLPSGALNENRALHTAVLLANGEVLVVGGVGPTVGPALASAERYDPATNRWRLTSPMATGRVRHSATTLPDGRVLVVGGASSIDQDSRPRCNKHAQSLKSPCVAKRLA